MSPRALPSILLVPFLVVAVVVSSSACGTFANFNGGEPPLVWNKGPDRPPVAFGGVQWDFEQAIESKSTAGEKVLILPLWLLDLSLSATLDTATLPIVFWVNARRAWERATGDFPPLPPLSPPPHESGEPGPSSILTALTPAEQLLIPVLPDLPPVPPKPE